MIKFKSRRLRWTCHVGRIEESRNALKFLPGKPTGRLLGVDGKTIIEYILNK